MPRILVIDDQSHVRAALVAALAANGFGAVAVENATAGLREFAASQFDLAIVDLFMPGMDGVKLIKTLRARAPRLPVIAMSGQQMRTTGRSALDLLPMAPDLADVVCLPKPFRPRELLAAIGKALGTPAAAES